MSFDYINEAFKRLDALNEDMFDTSLTGLNSLSDFMDQDDASDIVKVIDPAAETEDAVSDSYIGKVIINCNVCHSHIFETKEDVVIDEDGVVNPEMQCPYCGEMSGFTVVGEIKPFEQTTENEPSTEDEPEDSTVTDQPEDVVTESSDKNLSEGFNFDNVMSDIDRVRAFLQAKGYPCEGKVATEYLWGVIDLLQYGDAEITDETLEDWYNETLNNFPEDLDLLKSRSTVVESTPAEDDLDEGIFDKFKKKKSSATDNPEPEKEDPEKEKEAFTTYSYSEWIQALECGHKYYAEDGPEAGKTKLWDKAIEISACKNLAKDVTDCMDAWMKHDGNGNFPHKSYAKHLEEGIFNSSTLSNGDELNESIDELSLTANGTHIEVEEDENGKVTLTSEPVDSEPEDVSISPVSDETVQEIEANNSDEETPEESEDVVDIDLDEVDENSLDELGESYLKNIYENVDSFRTTSVSTTDSRMIVEGVITFNSGINKKTGFVFEACSASRDGRVKFVGKNEHFSSNRRAFALTGRISNKKLLPESLAYNYRVGARKITGTVNKQ